MLLAHLRNAPTISRHKPRRDSVFQLNTQHTHRKASETKDRGCRFWHCVSKQTCTLHLRVVDNPTTFRVGCRVILHNFLYVLVTPTDRRADTLVTAAPFVLSVACPLPRASRYLVHPSKSRLCHVWAEYSNNFVNVHLLQIPFSTLMALVLRVALYIFGISIKPTLSAQIRHRLMKQPSPQSRQPTVTPVLRYRSK